MQLEVMNSVCVLSEGVLSLEGVHSELYLYRYVLIVDCTCNKESYD